MSDMPANMPAERMWTLSDDQRSVRMQIPPLRLAGLPDPPRIHLDFDADGRRDPAALDRAAIADGAGTHEELAACPKFVAIAAHAFLRWSTASCTARHGACCARAVVGASGLTL